MPEPRCSIGYVLPVYNEAAGLARFHQELTAATARRPDLDFEFIYVDDGSTDGSSALLQELALDDPRVTVLSLARNCGHQTALTAGQDHATDHDAVIVMDCDLQDPPQVTLEFIREWEAGADMVYGVRRTRRDTWFKRVTAEGFYRVMSMTASLDLPRQVGDFRLMDHRVLVEVNKYREKSRFLRGIVTHVGFRQVAVEFDRAERFAGETHYPLRSMVKLAGDGILGFSTVPLKLISWLGFLVSFSSLLATFYVVGVRVLAPEQTVPGWAFLAVAMFMLSGIQLMMMGVIGSYLGRVYTEVLNRPLYSVAHLDRGPRRRRPSGTVEMPHEAARSLEVDSLQTLGS